MVILVHKFPLFHLNLKHSSSKLDNPHQSEPLLSFKSHVSNSLSRLSSPESEFLSLKWLKKCLDLLHHVNNGFAKLVAAIDYPITKWDSNSIDDYLNYTLHFLHLLNSITASISHLGESRVALSHALTLIETSPSAAIDRMNRIRWNRPVGDLKLDGTGKNRVKQRNCSGKESVIHQALLIMETTQSRVCGIVLSGLNNDDAPYNESRKFSNGFVDSNLMGLELGVGKVILEKGVIVKEVREVNEAVNSVVSSMGNENGDSIVAAAAKELERRLNGIEDELKGIENEVNTLFSKVMVGRNELLESLRSKKK